MTTHDRRTHRDFLFTEEEIATWKQRVADAYKERPGDGVRVFEDGRKGWNKPAWDRQERANLMWRAVKLQRMAERPDDILRTCVIFIGEKALQSIGYEEIWDADLVADRYTAANTARNRWLVHTVLAGLLKVPRSWGRSAALRFWRGTGKQKDSNYPGAGILGTKWGWKAREADCVSRVFYEGDIGALFMEDYSIGAYSEEAYAEDEDGNRLIDYDVQFKATTKERDDEFIKLLQSKLEAQGLEPYDMPKTKPKKVRKKKVWKVGQKIRQGTLRDLEPGQHFKWTVVAYKDGSYNSDPRPAESRSYEFVVVGRKTGIVQIRPILQGTALGVRDMSSTSLYESGYRWHSTEALYEGVWTGPEIDAPLAIHGWKPKKRSLSIPNLEKQARDTARAAREQKTS